MVESIIFVCQSSPHINLYVKNESYIDSVTYIYEKRLIKNRKENLAFFCLFELKLVLLIQNVCNQNVCNQCVCNQCALICYVQIYKRFKATTRKIMSPNMEIPDFFKKSCWVTYTYILKTYVLIVSHCRQQRQLTNK